MDKELLKKLPHENYHQYLKRLDDEIEKNNLPKWKDITDEVNKELYGSDIASYKSESCYRKSIAYAKAFIRNGAFTTDNNTIEELQNAKRELEREKIKFRDERRAWNKQNYIDARVEESLDLLEEMIINKSKVDFPAYESHNVIGNNDLLVCISDLHIGQTFDSYFGKYDTDIAKNRLAQYLSEVKSTKELYQSENCYVHLMGDLISGKIHTNIGNKENLIEQLKIVVELVESFIYELGKIFTNVYVYDVSGNHTRIDKKEDALHDERLDKLVSWAIGKGLSHIDNIHICENKVDTSISMFTIRDKTYVGVHGDYDSFSKTGVANLSMMLGIKPYAVLFGHMHVCKLDDMNGTKAIMSGCLSGSGDGYTIEKRLCGKPSQMICVCTNKGIKATIPVELN